MKPFPRLIFGNILNIVFTLGLNKQGRHQNKPANTKIISRKLLFITSLGSVFQEFHIC